MPTPAVFEPSPEQKSVIAHRDGHLQVIACAGAGKTEAISRRVTALIEEGVEPCQIVAFTFTERAAAGLKNRITRRIAEAKGDEFLDKLSPMYVGTIHAYCLHLLQTYVPEFGNFDILDENRLAGLVSREHKRLELNKLGNRHWAPIHEFLRNADVVENELLDPQKLKGTDFGDCYLKFKETLYRYHFLTYGLLISAAVKALARPDVFERVHGPLRHLIVDEYQDINPAQEQLIARLAEPPVHLCVVADDDQAIYQWRGSDVTNMQEFTQRYKKVKSVTLSVNRRSRPGIITAANAFAKSITPRLPKKMLPHRDAEGPEVCCWTATTNKTEAETIADTIQALVKRGYRYRDVAILFRSVRTSAPPLIAVLEERGVPFRCGGRTGLFLQPEASALGKLYAWLSGNDEWRNERWGQSEKFTFDDVLKDLQDVFNKGKVIADLKPYLKDWKKEVADNTGAVNLVHDYYKLLNLVGVQKLDLDQPADASRMGTLARFSQILADYEHVTRRARFIEENGERIYRGGTDRGTWFYLKLFNFLQYYAVHAYEDFEGEDTFDLDNVDILTVHQAKGLEWPVVFVPGLVRGRFPSKNAGKEGEWLLAEKIFPAAVRSRYEGGETEERRLFYVAMTRARDMLYLSRFQKLTNTFKPSLFLEEVAGGDPAVLEKLPLPPPFKPAKDEVDELPTVSFSELAAFEDCPYRFRMTNSLGFQPQLATELGYGKTIHHVLRKVAELAKKTKKLPTVKEVKAIFDDSFYLPFANLPAFEHLQERASALVQKYLAEYSDDLLRVWETERPFALHLPHGIVSGRADVILDQEGGVVNRLALVDYKTANDPKKDDIFAFQLAIYAAAGRGEGLNVEAAYLHQLKDSKRQPVVVDKPTVRKARNRAVALIESIVEGEFPARPETDKCKGCDMRAICKHAKCGKYDL